MGDPGHPARWSPGGLLLDPEDEEAELMAVHVFGLGWVMQVGAAVVCLCVNRCV